MDAFAAEMLASLAGFSQGRLEAGQPLPIQSSGKSAAATLVLLRGDLGAGKTAFSKAIAKELGVKDEITSPTFVIQKSYVPQGIGALPDSRFPFRKLVHIDAYRLEKPEELLSLGWKKLLAEPETLILLEWPERVETVLPSPVFSSTVSGTAPLVREIRFRFVDEGTREVEY